MKINLISFEINLETSSDNESENASDEDEITCSSNKSKNLENTLENERDVFDKISVSDNLKNEELLFGNSHNEFKNFDFSV